MQNFNTYNTILLLSNFIVCAYVLVFDIPIKIIISYKDAILWLTSSDEKLKFYFMKFQKDIKIQKYVE